MTRIPTDPPTSLRLRAMRWYAKRRFGETLRPAEVIAHSPSVFRTYVDLERGAERWRALDRRLGLLAVMASAHVLNFRWCTDFGYWIGRHDGLGADKLDAVPEWRSHRDRFDELECFVMEYAEQMTTDPHAITDEQVDALRTLLGEAGLVELTMTVALENLRARFNTAMGVPVQGFRERCEVTPT